MDGADLINACKAGDLSTVTRVLNAGADIGYRDSCGSTPLHHACRQGYIDTVLLLIERGADVRARDTYNNGTPLQYACIKGHCKIAGLLLDHGADANDQGIDGMSALHLACKEGNVDIARMLVEYGADLNARSWFKMTPIQYACVYGHMHTSRVLVEMGAEVRPQHLHECGISSDHSPADVSDSKAIAIAPNGSGICTMSAEFRVYARVVLPAPAVFAISAGVCNSVMDTVAYHYHTSVFAKYGEQSFWNPEQSWTNKWKNGDPAQGEAFFGSSTFLVWTTDAWHLFKAGWILFMLLTVLSTSHAYAHFAAVHKPKRALWKYSLITGLTIYLCLTCTFELFWAKIWPSHTK